MLDKLSNFIKNRQEHNDNIILGMDFNMDIRSRKVNSWIKSLNLKNALYDRHGTYGIATQVDNESNIPIDGVFCSMNLTPMAAGLRKLNEHYKSDHIPLWADFSIAQILGVKEKIPQPKPKSLRIDHPPSRNKLNKKVWKRIFKNKWALQLEELETNISLMHNNTLIDKYNNLQRNIINVRLQEAKRIRKLRMGIIPWSEEWAKAHITLEAWITLLNWRKKGSRKLKFHRVRTTVKKANWRGRSKKISQR